MYDDGKLNIDTAGDSIENIDNTDNIDNINLPPSSRWQQGLSLALFSVTGRCAVYLGPLHCTLGPLRCLSRPLHCTLGRCAVYLGHYTVTWAAALSI